MSRAQQLAARMAPALPAVRMRQGFVESVAGRFATVTVGGGTTQFVARAYDHVTLTAGKACWLVTDGRDWFVFGTTNL